MKQIDQTSQCWYLLSLIMYTREFMISEGTKNNESQPEIGFKKSVRSLPEDQQDEFQRYNPEQQLPFEQKRKSEKNKFINKLKQFQRSSHSEMVTKNQSYPSSSALSIRPEHKKQRNKIAARQSRDRKRLYVNLMESKIERLETELQETIKQIQKVRLDIYSAEMRQAPKGKQANHRQIHIIKKLEGLLEDQELQQRNNQINICLDSIIYRIGALGKERKSALSKLYSDLLNFSQPALYRYILWSAVKRKHLFGSFESTQEEKWCKQIEQITNQAISTAASRGQDFMVLGQKIASQKFHFQKSSRDLVKFRQKIQKKGQEIQNVFSEIREALSPQQVANLILFVEKYQFKKQVRLFEDETAESMGKPQKKIKIDGNQ